MQRIFPIEEFLATFPEFADETKFSKPSIQGAGNRAMFWLPASFGGISIPEPQFTYALFLMAAHIIALRKTAEESSGSYATGGLAGMPFKATVGSVSVETTKPNSFTSDDWTHWLSRTEYGMEYLAFMDIQAQPISTETPESSARDLV